MNPPRGYETWNRALRGAFRKGYEAAKNLEPIDSCPYKDKRKPSGRLTWSRAFRTAWHDGYEWWKTELLTNYYSTKRQHGRVIGPSQR